LSLGTLVEVSLLRLLVLIVEQLLLLGCTESLGVNVVGHVHTRCRQEACGFVQGSLITYLVLVLSLRELCCTKLVLTHRSSVRASLVCAADASFVFLVELVVGAHTLCNSIHDLWLLDAGAI